jgi:hypothetical protein
MIMDGCDGFVTAGIGRGMGSVVINYGDGENWGVDCVLLQML